MNATTSLLLLAALALPTSGLAAQARPGSIYDANRGPRGIIADKTAYQTGDILTVVIRETTEISNEDSGNLSRSSSLDYRLASFDLKPNLFGTLPNVSGSTASDFQGNASQERSGSFTARISVVVVDALPNGNLVISGRREIKVDQDTKLIEFTGIVRRYDIAANNTVSSELVANAEIIYRGNGPLTNHSGRRGVSRAVHGFLMWIWPF